MKSGIFVVMILMTLGISQTVAQKTATSEIKTTIYCSHCQQCETCGLRFDESLYKLKGLKYFSIDPAADIIKVSYNPKKLSLSAIRNCIAECGYDADDVKATEAGLSTLDGCCRKNE